MNGYERQLGGCVSTGWACKLQYTWIKKIKNINSEIKDLNLIN